MRAGPKRAPFAPALGALLPGTASPIAHRWPRASLEPQRPLPLPRRREAMPEVVVPMVVSIPGSGAPILLPVADGRSTDVFARYASRLELYGGFSDQAEVVQALTRVVAEAEPLANGTGPLIGIVLAEPEQLFGQSDDAIRALIAKVVARGGRPVLIPPRTDLLFPQDKAAYAKGIQALVGSLDGMIGPGGNDVHPFIYHQKNRYAVDTNLARDRAEAALVLAALASELYALGICRSHQLWNAISGGALVQDVQKEGYAKGSQRQLDFGIPLEAPFVRRDEKGRVIFENRVSLRPRSRFRQIVGRKSVLTNSSHHQAVKNAGKGFLIVGSVRDPQTRVRTVEATESRNAITTQWHPEILESDAAGDRLFDTLVHRAEIYRIIKEERATSGQVRVDRVAERMMRHARYRFSAVDFKWLREDAIGDRRGG